MNMRDTARQVEPAPFADFEASPAQHLRLALFGAIERVIGCCGEGDVAAALEQHPFLADYLQLLAASAPPGALLPGRWSRAVGEWEQAAVRQGARLPLAALREAGLPGLAIELLLAVGLVEEDPRFGPLLASVQGEERRPTFGLLMAWWRIGEEGEDRVEAVRQALLDLIHQGLVEVRKGDGPRPEWVLAVPHALWDALRGEAPRLRWLTHVPPDALPASADYIPPQPAGTDCPALAAALQREARPLLLVRGPSHNGRKTLVGCLARELGKAMLVADAGVLEEEPRWRLFGALCVLLDAMPVLHCELAAGESRSLPALPFMNGPLAVVSSRHGAWSSAEGRPVLAIELPLPGLAARVAHWHAVLPGQPVERVLALARAARLASGDLRRAARAAASFTSLAHRHDIEAPDLQQACRGLQSARLETLATRLAPPPGLQGLCVDDPTREELDALEARCRLREELAASGGEGAGANSGVRVLLAGASGTGKTLAARRLAAALGKDLYRIDLAATVNKYLGETEKSLNNAFSAAEELDVVLLLDEGDALMANRTDVGTANDRYANLETNFLLQRVESFDGILVVTSNASDRIDAAFARRMDVVIHFRPPDEWQRYRMFGLQLERDAVDDELLQEIASRCTLTGAQIHNVVLHARLLSIQAGTGLGPDQLHAALAREYRKIGGHCPLRPARGAGAF